MTAAVIAALEVVAATPAKLAEMTAAVGEQIRGAGKLVDRRRAFVDALGPSGELMIAESIAGWWRATRVPA